MLLGHGFGYEVNGEGKQERYRERGREREREEGEKIVTTRNSKLNYKDVMTRFMTRSRLPC